MKSELTEAAAVIAVVAVICGVLWSGCRVVMPLAEPPKQAETFDFDSVIPKMGE